jgi:type II secretory pathway pseudopilin PulG
MTCATIVAVPLIGRTDVAVVNEMLDPDGARSGTRLHASSMTKAIVGMRKRAANRLRDIMKALNILIPMDLAGQGEKTRIVNERGYAMATFLVALVVMTIVMSAAMPVWKQMVQREKEEELVFRGEQIAHAIGMFQRRTANAYPPNIDVLVQQHLLRKKYKDPITNDDFQPIAQSQPQGAQGGRGAQPGQTQGRGQPAGNAGSALPGGAPAGGIIGVTSKSTDTSIRLYKGRSHYNEWAFIYTPPASAPGAGGPGAGAPGGRGQRGGQQPGPVGIPNTGRGTTSQPAPFQPGGPNGRGGPGTGRGNFPNPFGTQPGRGR